MAGTKGGHKARGNLPQMCVLRDVLYGGSHLEQV